MPAAVVTIAGRAGKGQILDVQGDRAVDAVFLGDGQLHAAPDHEFGEFLVVHGREGRGSLPAPALRTRPVPGHAVQRILETVAPNPSEVTIVAMGRLTNVALACLLEPETMKLVRNVVWMGGAVSVSGNTSPVAEANLDGDPEALRIVLAHAVPLTILPLDVTMDVRLTQDDLNGLATSAHPAVAHLTRLVPFYLDAYESILGVRECALRCGLLMGIVMDPGLVTSSIGALHGTAPTAAEGR
ncbi:nucleoside hydrolase [Streptomyces sp. NPDC004838]